jgi:CheY-like chemotaxis protein
VIILTAKGQDADREQALELGADRLLHQAVQPEQAARAINEIFVDEDGLWGRILPAPLDGDPGRRGGLALLAGEHAAPAEAAPPLASDQPLIRDTVERILPLIPQERLRILTGATWREPILGALPGARPGNLLLEPRAAGTAPVLAWAAAELERRDPDAVMVSLHATT